MGGVLAFDLSPSICGWCAGDGADTPSASAWTMPEVGSDLGWLVCEMEDQARLLIDVHRPVLVVYEAPILLRHDALLTLRMIYPLGAELERVCRRLEIRCGEVDLRRIKSVLTDNPHADKKDVVKAVLGLGISLPKTVTEGRQDAADAAGAWLIGLMEADPLAAAPWIARLKGTLL